LVGEAREGKEKGRGSITKTVSISTSSISEISQGKIRKREKDNEIIVLTQKKGRNNVQLKEKGGGGGTIC